jgi:biopolymer transport protein ExbD
MAGFKTSGGRYKPQAGSQMAAPNVIPMADIMLVLLIIFMVVTPMLQKTLPVDMARVNNAREMQDADKDDAIIVAVTRDGTIYLKNTKITKDDITGQIKDLIANRLDKTVYVKSDQRAKYGDVVAVVDEIRSAGVDQLGLLTEQNQERRTTPAPPNPNAAAPTADLGTAKARRSGRS